MASEIEVKIAVESAAAARKRIRAAGLTIHAPRVFEVNVLYDTPAQSLRTSGRIVRLRQAGKTSTLTFMGRSADTTHKVREEIETTVARPAAIERILRELGLQPVFRYEKRRTEYTANGPNGHVMLDETPIGTFLEVEGSPRWIDRTAKQLGFSPSDYILLSYGALYLAWCREHGIKPSNMVF
jgi:adenylate cyclase class 2